MRSRPVRRNKIRLVIAAAFLAAAGAACASSNDAWQEFAADVEAKCRKAAHATMEDAHAVVDPFGSEHYGMAIVTGKPRGANGFITHICVYDKQAKTAEIGSEFKTDQLRLLPEE